MHQCDTEAVCGVRAAVKSTRVTFTLQGVPKVEKRKRSAKFESLSRGDILRLMTDTPNGPEYSLESIDRVRMARQFEANVSVTSVQRSPHASAIKRSC